MPGVAVLGPAGLGMEHAPQRCPVCLRLGSHAMALLAFQTDGLPRWQHVVTRQRRDAPDVQLGGHIDNVQRALELAYEDVVERCLALTDAAIRCAHTWESALFRGLQAAMRETANQPGAISLHYYATTADASGRLLAVRDSYIRRLVDQYSLVRDDSPPRLAVEMAIGMAHHALRAVAPTLEGPAEQVLSRVAFSFSTAHPAGLT